MTITGSAPWAQRSSASDVPCPRCGIKREARKGTVLCESCRYTLTAEEAKAWRKAA